MTRCKSCGKTVPDGMDYCEDCVSKLNTAKDSESYLDSLLNSVMTQEPNNREAAFRKKKADSPVLMSERNLLEETPASMELEPAPEEEIPTELVEEPTELEEEAAELMEVPAELEEEPTEVEEDTLAESEADIAELLQMGNDEEKQGEEIPAEMEEDAPAESEADIAELLQMGNDEEKQGEEIPAEMEEDAPAESEADIAELLQMGNDEEKQGEEISAETEEGKQVVDMQDSGEDDSVVDKDLIELLSGFSENEGGLFEFGAEPEEQPNASTDETTEEQQEIASETVSKESEKKQKKKKRGPFSALYHKLFDNVKLKESEIKRIPTEEELEEQKKAKQEAKEKAKEEKETLLAEKKDEEKRSKEEKQRRIKEAKEEKKARKLEEAKLLLEEMESTRINRAGASIIFIFFAMIAVVIVVGTSIFSYSLSIKNAEYEFNRDEYTAAYNEIFGLDVKDEDIVLYDRIMTVMYVQKQLNSYYNYYELGQYPQALDSLLKGLQRYEKYIELAVALEIEDDLDNVRGSETDQSAGKKSILGEIYATFDLTEREAMEIIQSSSRAEYSKRVYDAVDGMTKIVKEDDL